MPFHRAKPYLFPEPWSDQIHQPATGAGTCSEFNFHGSSTSIAVAGLTILVKGANADTTNSSSPLTLSNGRRGCCHLLSLAGRNCGEPPYIACARGDFTRRLRRPAAYSPIAIVTNGDGGFITDSACARGNQACICQFAAAPASQNQSNAPSRTPPRKKILSFARSANIPAPSACNSPARHQLIDKLDARQRHFQHEQRHRGIGEEDGFYHLAIKVRQKFASTAPCAACGRRR